VPLLVIVTVLEDVVPTRTVSKSIAEGVTVNKGFCSGTKRGAASTCRKKAGSHHEKCGW